MAEPCGPLGEKRVSIEDRAAAERFEEFDGVVDLPLRRGTASCDMSRLDSQEEAYHSHRESSSEVHDSCG